MIGALGSIGGIRVFTDHNLVERTMIARSPSRALRRWAKGKRKVSPWRITPSTKAFRLPDGSMVCHPSQWAALKTAISITSIGQERL